jgi:hypothetical protein
MAFSASKPAVTESHFCASSWAIHTQLFEEGVWSCHHFHWWNESLVHLNYNGIQQQQSWFPCPTDPTPPFSRTFVVFLYLGPS